MITDIIIGIVAVAIGYSLGYATAPKLPKRAKDGKFLPKE